MSLFGSVYDDAAEDGEAIDAAPPPATSVAPVDDTDGLAELAALIGGTEPIDPPVDPPAPVEPNDEVPTEADHLPMEPVPEIALEPAPLSLGAFDDDILPARSRSRSFGSVPELSGGLRKVVIVVLAAAVGFMAFRMATNLLAGPDDPAGQESEAAPTGEPSIPRTPGEALAGAARASAQADLQRVVMAAAAAYAERETFDLDPAEWSDLTGIPVQAATAAGAEAGTVVVSATPEAACFETATAGGVALAAGLLPEGARYAQSGRGPLCSTDPAVLRTWSASFTG